MTDDTKATPPTPDPSDTSSTVVEANEPIQPAPAEAAAGRGQSAQGDETMTITLKHGYAPIEQYQHKGQGPWTDVYGLSATIYYCLTGKTPPQALDRLLDDDLIRPRSLGVHLDFERLPL